MDTRERGVVSTVPDFYDLLERVLVLLQQHKRVTYRALQRQFDLDAASLEDLKAEIIEARQLAVDEGGRVLVWTGGVNTPSAPAVPAAPLARHVTPEGRPNHEDVVAIKESVVEAERRQLTVLFCDLVDSTKLAGQLDPEDYRDVVRAYQAACAEVIRRLDGTIAQYLGDGLLVYFGYPQAHEDDAQRAVHAGLGIVERIDTTLNPRLEREQGLRLGVRIGINTGPVVIGAMGDSRRSEHLATGETVNIAARLEALARANTVSISSVTARLVERVFALEDQGLQTLKGVAEPMRVFQAVGLLDIRRDEAGAPGVPFLVGRDEEMGLLLRRWEQSKEGLGQVVLLSGEAGIGKSSLVATVRHRVVQEGHSRMTFRCSPYHINSALHPVIAYLEGLAQFQAEDTPETRLDKLEGMLGGHGRSFEEVVPLYAALLSVPVPPGRYPASNLTPQQQRHQTQEALVGWLLEEAERRPTLAMWEDLHWADPSTLEMLASVLEQTPTVRMLHVLTFRPEFGAPWRPRSHMTPITLNRLERPQVEALITHLARGKSLPPEVNQHIIATTDGVPLYVEEMTKMLLESELLREHADRYTLAAPLGTVTIPHTLQDSLMARLDQHPSGKQVAQLGAVIGREFSYDLLEAIAPQEEETLQIGLAQVVHAELLYQRGRPPRARYVFKHALVQETAYRSLLRSTRQQAHQRIARVLEDRFAETVATQPELIAHHYTEAGDAGTAIVYWQRAGERAIHRSAHAEAIAHLTRGLGVLMALPETPERERQELDLHVTLGPALIAIKGQAASEVKRAFDRARELCLKLGETAQLFPVLRGLMLYHQARGQLSATAQLGEELLALAHSQPDPRLLVLGHFHLGLIKSYQGELAAARAHHAQALAMYGPRDHPELAAPFGFDLGVAARRVLAWELWQLGFPDQARQHMEEALIMAARHLSHSLSQAEVLNFAMLLHVACREPDATYRRSEEAIAVAQAHGLVVYELFGTLMRGWALAALGNFEEGIAQMHHGLAGTRSHRIELFAPYFRGHLAEAYANGGQPEEGLALLAEALALVEAHGERFYEAELYRLRGEIALKTQAACGTAAAVASFQQALTVARRQQAKSWELRAATSLARLWQSQGKHTEARDLLGQVYGWFTEGFDTADLKEARALLEALA